MDEEMDLLLESESPNASVLDSPGAEKKNRCGFVCRV